MRGYVIAAAILATVCGPVFASDEKKPKPIHYLGMVKKLTKKDANSIGLKYKGKTYEVSWTNTTEITVHATKKLEDLKANTIIHVLARKQAAQPGTTGGQFPPMLVNVRAMALGKDFTPPPVPAKLRTSGIRWVEGKLKMRKKELWLDDHQIVAGKNQKIFTIAKGDPKKLKPKQQIFVTGTLDPEKRKPKLIRAEQIIAIAEDIPAAEYELIFDFSGKSRKKKKDPLDF